MRYLNSFFIYLTPLFFLSSCTEIELFEKQKNIPGGKWKQMDKLIFELNVPDANKNYYMMASIRHTGFYPYRNIWVRLGIQQSGMDSVSYQDFEIPLANSEQWLGAGVNNVYDRRVRLFQYPVKFKTPGMVQFTLEHIMRDEELPGILQAGVRIEPANP